MNRFIVSLAFSCSVLTAFGCPSPRSTTHLASDGAASDRAQGDVPIDLKGDLSPGIDVTEEDGGPGDDAQDELCPTGQHMCAALCVNDSDPRNCGSSCTPCQVPPGGTATCTAGVCGGSCPPGMQLCMGSCVDSTMSCATGCPVGRHPCGALCPSAQDENACGTSCSPCPVPVGASQATCDGVRCGFVCMSGFHACGTTCARDTSAAACGAACTVCPTAANGTAICNGGTCAIQCMVGFHLCGGACVSDTAITSCGTSCTACPTPTGGTATCVQGACGGMCAGTEKLCNGSCISANGPCLNVCPTGMHNCGGICADNNSTNSCGTACTACPMPTGATAATCDGTKCEFSCRAGFHRCGAVCAADSDATACGMACTACPTDPNGTATCQANACGLMCKVGFHLCGGRCVDNLQAANCGAASCTACPVPAGGMATCNGVACGTTCPSGQRICGGACILSTAPCSGLCPSGSHPCSGTCLPDSAVGSCGTRCSACPTPASGSATCDGTNCGIACASGFKNCPGTTTCVANSACCTPCTGATPFCQNGTCVKRPVGQSCSAAAECASGFCDGVCCSTACTGQCEKCNSAGSCVAVTTPRTACAGSGTCVGKCDGKLPTACVFPGSSTSCRAQSCSDGVKTAAAGCNGAGACSAAVMTSCQIGTCTGTDCSACQCRAGETRDCGSCLPKATCGTNCGYSTCGTVLVPGCCLSSVTDSWKIILTDKPQTGQPWSIYKGDPDTVDADDHEVLYAGDRIARDDSVTPGYIATVTVTLNATGNGTFAFDFGDTMSSRLFPALRVGSNGGNGILQVGGARPPVSPSTVGVWGAFGSLSGQENIASGTTAIMRVYVKSNAVALRVRIGNTKTKTDGFMPMNPRNIHLAHYMTIDGSPSGVATLEPILFCKDLSDAAVQNRFTTDPDDLAFVAP